MGQNYSVIGAFYQDLLFLAVAPNFLCLLLRAEAEGERWKSQGGWCVRVDGPIIHHKGAIDGHVRREKLTFN